MNDQPVSPMVVVNDREVQAVLQSKGHSPGGKASMVAARLIQSYPALFEGQSPAAMARVQEALTGVIRTNPQLVDAIATDMPSFCDAVLTAIGLGLSFQPTLGHCYLIPRRVKGAWKVCFQLGYRGLLELARRSGTVLMAQAEMVYPSDRFEVSYGTSRRIAHEPDVWADGRVYANALGAYATATLAGGVVDFDVLSKADIERARAVSRAESGPWKEWPEEMAKKTALRRLLKRLGLSVEAAGLLDRDDRDNAAEQQPLPSTIKRAGGLLAMGDLGGPGSVEQPFDPRDPEGAALDP